MAAAAEMAAIGFVPDQVRERAAAQPFGQPPGRRCWPAASLGSIHSAAITRGQSMTKLSDFTAILADREARQPGAVAMSFGPSHWTWAEWAARVRRNAAAQRSAGLMPGDRIAVLDMNHPSCLELTLACAQVGTVLTFTSEGEGRGARRQGSNKSRDWTGANKRGFWAWWHVGGPGMAHLLERRKEERPDKSGLSRGWRSGRDSNPRPPA